MSITPFRLPIAPMIVKETYISMLKKGLRPDNRDLNTPRLIEISTGVIDKAEGSAIVKLGGTQVMAGVKADVGTPYRDTPNQGGLMVHAEFVPLASPLFEPGPPDENAIELARIVDRSLREVRAVDLESLVIRRGEKAWFLWIDLYILDHNGNLYDASMMAAMAALATTRLPEYEELETGEIVVNRRQRSERLKVNTKVVSVTIAKIGEFLLVDPNLEEEAISDVKLVVAVDEGGRVVGMQKTGIGGMTPQEVDKALDTAIEASKVYFKALEEAISGG